MGGGLSWYNRNIERVLIRMKLEKYKQRNPKNIGIAIFTIVCVLLIAFVFIYSSFASFETNETRTFINGNVVDPGDLYFAFYVDGVISSTMPGKGEGYTLDKEKTTCTNGATVEWLDDEWAPKILNFTQTRTKCTLYFKVLTAVDVILAKGETEELKFDNTKDNNLRYVGANPNNYVRFNNELWRIIGVFNNIENGSGTKETRIKLIRDEPIGKYSWDNKPSGTGSSTSSYGSNDWTDSTLKEVLNNGPYWNRASGNCPSGRDGATTSCDFSTNGLTEEAKRMISDAVWNLGGLSNSSNISSRFYTSERSTSVYSGHATEWTGKIGLMYPSDYGYATSGGSGADRETCLNTVLLDWNDYDDCFNNDWLYNSSNYQWTLTPYSGNSYYPLLVISNGRVSTSNLASHTSVVFPALYLNSNVKISGGSGTEESPYTLSIE